MSLLELFCHVDDFYKQFKPYWQSHTLTGQDNRHVRSPRMSMSEIMTIVIHFHQSQYRNFKAYYTEHVSKQLNSEFPALVSYNRFVELMPRVQLPLLAYFIYCRGKCSGISFVDSTPIKVFFSWSLIVSMIDRFLNMSLSARGISRFCMFLRTDVTSCKP